MRANMCRTKVVLFHAINSSLHLLAAPSLIHLEIHLLNWVFASLFLFDQTHNNEQNGFSPWNCNVDDDLWGNRKTQQETHELLGFLSSFSSVIPLQVSVPPGLVFACHIQVILARYNMARLHFLSPSANQIKNQLNAITTLRVRKLCLKSSLYLPILSLEPFVLFQCCPLISIKLVPRRC